MPFYESVTILDASSRSAYVPGVQRGCRRPCDCVPTRLWKIRCWWRSVVRNNCCSFGEGVYLGGIRCRFGLGRFGSLALRKAWLTFSRAYASPTSIQSPLVSFCFKNLPPLSRIWLTMRMVMLVLVSRVVALWYSLRCIAMMFRNLLFPPCWWESLSRPQMTSTGLISSISTMLAEDDSVMSIGGSEKHVDTFRGNGRDDAVLVGMSSFGSINKGQAESCSSANSSKLQS